GGVRDPAHARAPARTSARRTAGPAHQGSRDLPRLTADRIRSSASGIASHPVPVSRKGTTRIRARHTWTPSMRFRAVSPERRAVEPPSLPERPMSEPTTPVSAAIAAELEQHASDVFALMGNGNAWFLDAVVRRGAMQLTTVRH